jgi:hypothetical protein
MKPVFLLIAVSALLVTLGFAQTPEAGSNSDPANVKGCLGGSDGNYTVVEDGSRQIFKITTSSVDLKPHLGHDVKLTGHKASEAASSGAADTSFAVTELSMISEHCGAAAAASVGAIVPYSQTVIEPATTPAPAPSAPAVDAAAPAATVNPSAVPPSTPAVEAAAPAATVSPSSATVSTPVAEVAAPVTTVSPSSAAPSTPAVEAAAPAATVSPSAAPVSTPAAEAAAPAVTVSPSAATVSTPTEKAAHSARPSTHARRSATQSGAAPAATVSPTTAGAAPASPASETVSPASADAATANPSSENASAPAAAATTPTVTHRAGSLSLLISFVVLVIVLGTFAPLLLRWRKRKILERTGTPNLSFTNEVSTKEASSERDKPEPRKVA